MNKKVRFLLILSIIGVGVGISPTIAHASPFGEGLYDANVPYGGSTSLAISTSGNVIASISNPTSSGALSSSSGTVTVTSSDVVGYSLYARALGSTNMINGTSSIPASSNGTAGALAVNTWGFNTDGSANYLGMGLTDTLIHSLTGPATTGDTTSVTYGIDVDNTKQPGSYQVSVLYTAVPQTN